MHASLLRLPLNFEANHGQAPAEVKFFSRGPGYTLSFLAGEVVFAVPKHSTGTDFLSNAARANLEPASWRAAPAVAEPAVLRMTFVGGNEKAEISGVEQQRARSNYFFGADMAEWRTNIPNYAKVRYANVYPGIDLVFYGNPQEPEYDFIVSPGANPDAIRLRFSGADMVEIARDGDLLIHFGGEVLRQRKPVIYQIISGRRREIPGGIELLGSHEARFLIQSYDHAKPLVIDPILDFATYLGGSRNDEANAIAIDSSANVYVAGSTYSLDFPASNFTPPDWACAAQEPACLRAFVTKLNSTGSTVIYSAYFGGSGISRATDLAVDAAGNAFVVGATSSADFPTTGGAFQTLAPGVVYAPTGGAIFDGFVLKLNEFGSRLVYSTYLGGQDHDSPWAIEIDSTGNAIVAGGTRSSDFPVSASALQPAYRGAQECCVEGDGFVSKINSSGSSLTFSTFLGGTRDDRVNTVAIDAANNIYLAGSTTSPDFPVTAGAFQATYSPGGIFVGSTNSFVAKLTPTGTILSYATFLAGSGTTIANGIAVDTAGNAFVAGTTNAGNFPITPGAYQTTKKAGAFFLSVGSNAFISKLNPTGTSLVYSTFLGGSGSVTGFGSSQRIVADGASDIAVDVQGNAHVIGATSSRDFPTLDAFQNVLDTTDFFSVNLPADAFVTKLNPTGTALVSSTLLGGRASDVATGIAVDSFGNEYVAGTTTVSLRVSNTGPINSFPVTGESFQSSFGGPNRGSDGFVAKLTNLPISPVLPAFSMVNGASFQPATDLHSALSPGMIVSVFGTNLASQLVQGSRLPLPTQILETSLTIGNLAAPLFAVGPTQVNAQIPFELLSGTSTVRIRRGTQLSSIQSIAISAFSPGIFTLNQRGTGPGAILIANSGTYAAPIGSVPEARPARSGEIISIYCTGLGAVTHPPASGAAAPATPPSATTTLPSVTIGGVPAEVSYSGLAPGFVGLYQVNVAVPANAPTGDAVPLSLSIGGVASNTVTVAVQ